MKYFQQIKDIENSDNKNEDNVIKLIDKRLKKEFNNLNSYTNEHFDKIKINFEILKGSAGFDIDLLIKDKTLDIKNTDMYDDNFWVVAYFPRKFKNKTYLTLDIVRSKDTEQMYHCYNIELEKAIKVIKIILYQLIECFNFHSDTLDSNIAKYINRI